MIKQSTFIKKLFNYTNLINANSTSLLILTGIMLKSVDDDSLFEGNKITIYRQIVGSVLYFSNNTRFNTSYAVRQLIRFILKSAIIYLQIYKHLLRYLISIIEVRITYSSRRNVLPLIYVIYTDII